MPVDENIISEKLRDLDIKINESYNKTAKLRRLRKRLERIQMRETTDPMDSTKRIQLPPIDEGINKPMTVPRRQALFDSIITEVENELI